MDKTYFLYSNEGNIIDRKSRKRSGKAKFRGISYDQVCALGARDRQKMTYSSVIGRGCVRTSKLDEAIGGKLNNLNVLSTILGEHLAPTPKIRECHIIGLNLTAESV